MAHKGRPTKPIEQKRLLGNPGKRPLPEPGEIVQLPQATSVPEPTRPLGNYGRELWDRIWGIGVAWISPQTDYELLLMTCEMVDERWNLRVKVMRENDPKDRRALRNLETQITGNLSLLGLSPADRTRLGVAEVKKMSKLAELRSMRNE